MAARGHLLLLLPLALTAGCADRIAPAKTQLEVRAFQTYTFDTADNKLVMKGLFNVLQDDGYVVRNAVIELGLITATKETDLAPGRSGQPVLVIGGSFGGSTQEAPIPHKIEVRDFTGNVTELGERTRTSVPAESAGQPRVPRRGHDHQPSFYRDFFARMDKSVFLQNERL